MSEWISVKDRLPIDNQVVLGYTPIDGYIFIGYYRKDPMNERYPRAKRKEWYIFTSMRSTQKVTKRNPPSIERRERTCYDCNLFLGGACDGFDEDIKECADYSDCWSTSEG